MPPAPARPSAWRRWFLRGLIGLALLISLPVMFVTAVLIRLWLGVPALDGAITSPALSAPVTVVHDADAIPHISAETSGDAYFALGYLHARDRLWQMEIQRRVMAGRASEILPIGALIRVDRLMRTLGFYRLAQDDIAILDAELVADLEAYAAGVNHYLDTRTEPLPIEFWLTWHTPERWQVADTVVWGKLMALVLSGNFRSEVAHMRLAAAVEDPARLDDLFPQELQDRGSITLGSIDPALINALDWAGLDEALGPSPGPDRASNAWAVSGAHTASGLPVMATDPHLSLNAPSQWYLARIVTPDMSLVGATPPGVPMHLYGHNGTIAWGLTTTGGDVQDLYLEEIDPDDDGSYRTLEGFVPFETREETVRVRFGADQTFTVRATRNGPVVSDLMAEDLDGVLDAEHVLALKSPAVEPGDTTAEAVWRLNRATSWDQFLDATRRWVAPQQNIVYADTGGTIGFIAPGHIPVRRTGDGLHPLPGWDDANQWAGLIPFEGLPQASNPPNGRVVNANNRIVGPGYPHHITHEWDAAYRADRANQLLDATRPHDPAASAAMLRDIVGLDTKVLLPLLLAAEPTTGAGKAARGLMDGWDGSFTVDDPQPLIYVAWATRLKDAFAADELGDAIDAWRPRDPVVFAHLVEKAPDWCDDVTTEDATESCPEILGRALDEAATDLANAYGDVAGDWRWGDAHKAPQDHVMLSRLPVIGRWFDLTVEIPGGDHTLYRANHTSEPGSAYPAIHGAGFRAVYDFADLASSGFVISTGQSGNPFSSHYGDFVDRWAAGDLVLLGDDPAQIAANGGVVLTMTPTGGRP